MPEGLEILSVAPGSPAAQMRLRAGDRIMAMQGEKVVDLIDYLYFADDPELSLTVRRGEHTFETSCVREAAGELGIRLVPGQQDIAVCRNRCRFCFVDQMPRGFRPTLYVKDDDWRLSFLHGSYVTLTNLTDEDYSRIERRCVSPLYVSVHATDDAVRTRLLGTPLARGIRGALERLVAGGTSFYAQCVLVEGENDGAVLEKTVRDLAALHPYARSVALVPVGLTDSREGLAPIRPMSAAGASAVLDLAQRLQDEFLHTLGTRFVFAADELYLTAGRPLPPAGDYEDFGQLENGVGLAADFRQSAEAALAQGGRPRPGRFLAVTGLGIAEAAAALAARLRGAGIDIESCGVANRTFGRSVNVTGLLTGADLIADLKDRTGGRTVLLPDVMFRDGDGVTLDNMTPLEIGRRIGTVCSVVPSEGSAFVRALLEPEGRKQDHV